MLRPKGIAYIQVPFNAALSQTDEDPSVLDPFERKMRFGQFDHVRVYGADMLDRLRENSAFDVIELRISAILRKEEMSRYGLWDDVIWRCTRRS